MSTKLELKLRLSEHDSIIFRSDDSIHLEMIVLDAQLLFIQPSIEYY